MMKDYLSKPEINFFLSIAVPLIALAVSWGIWTTRLVHLENDFAELKEVEEAHIILTQSYFDADDTKDSEIQIRLAEIQKDIVYIRQALDRHLVQ